jgi:hypothetical protein
MTTDDRKALRRRALWTVADFARYLGVSHWQAKTALLRYNVALGGTLLRSSTGTNRGYTFFWALLAKHDESAFLDDPIEQQQRVDVLEDLVGDIRRSMQVIAAQTGHNTRDIIALRRIKRSAA